MSGPEAAETPQRSMAQMLVFWLSVTFVIVGLINAMPGIPGLDDWAIAITGNDKFVIRKFPFEYYYTMAFTVMMVIVALQHSMWRAWVDKSKLRRGFGLFMDVALVLMAVTISLTYLVEIESVCIIDQITGDRARLIAESLLIEKENAVLFGMGMPAVPAYINVALLMGPVLAGLGVSVFTANMFIFYFAVASAITPPVALAAFAASTITKAEPMATGFAAVKVGIVMFVIPFVFALYPEILLIEAAVIDPSTSDGAVIEYLPGYSGQVDWR